MGFGGRVAGVGACVAVAVAAFWMRQPPPSTMRTPLAAAPVSAPAFPVRPAAHVPPARARRASAARPLPNDPLRALAQAPDVREFVLERIESARAGDGASAYVVYMALDQCRNYLSVDADTADANFARMLADVALTSGERVAWQIEYERCRGFTRGDWSVVGEALGDERPGSVEEYASFWFERAARAGHAPALAEMALRPSEYRADERAAMLAQALPSGDPDVYWWLFAHGLGSNAAPDASALAWLLLACEQGYDCSNQARWYRARACLAEEGCPDAESALAHYWVMASPQDRRRALAQLAEMKESIGSGRWQALPLPDLDALDMERFWGRSET